ncbi:ABC transporter ATP-binding protein [Nocardioides donggukensis]|uniref:ABC-type quaternary amine transporter n=1 Tax=Nocardioides donggukensis TaxID=2774019 RepID=A0A927Q255_9ACTN|nr:ABC transporter ATP-binding protein [Nocardioides donggukensis]MBD8870887.1 ABC transporter ATP-binding protein [Nocardioides donggukensis]
MTETGLELDGVTVRFDGTPVVDRVGMRLPAGAVLAVLGPSGCGKSTLLRAVAGLEPLDDGVIRYAGRDLHGVPTHRRGFALMFQDGQLFAHRSVAENVGYPLRIRRRPRRESAGRVEELLSLVGLEGYGDRSPATLSGGERQRVALARALAVEPRLLLLDEPLSALDSSLRSRLAGDLRSILVAAGTTALLVTHDHDEAFAVADRIALMRSGRLVQQGTPGEVWRAPADAEAARFLGYASVLDGDPARRVLAAAGLPTGHQVALRRSALAVAEDGPLVGTVRSARATPEALRLVVDVAGVGEVEAVAHGSGVGPGERVRLAVDPGRLAEVPMD